MKRIMLNVLFSLMEQQDTERMANPILVMDFPAFYDVIQDGYDKIHDSLRPKCSAVIEIITIKVTCPAPFDRCTNLAEGQTGMSDGGIQDAGDGYSCECEDRRVYDQSSDTCVCMGQG